VAKKQKGPAGEETPLVDPLLRLANVLAIFALKEIPPEDAAVRLDKLGFSAREIAGVLGVSDNYILVINNRKKAAPKKKARAKS
jgi:hypothetical protein